MDYKMRPYQRILASILILALVVCLGTKEHEARAALQEGEVPTSTTVTESAIAASEGAAEASPETDSIERARQWLKTQQAEDGHWGDDALINDTCAVLAVMGDTEGVEDAYRWLEKRDYKNNADMLARVCRAKNDYGEEIEKLLECQNTDGGFGVTAEYESDVYDTWLVLECLLAYGDVYKDNIAKAMQYFLASQREDGGWTYDGEQSDDILTVNIATMLCRGKYEYQLRGDAMEYAIEKANAYVLANIPREIKEDSLRESIYNIHYMIEKHRGKKLDEYAEQIVELQKENGSFGDCIDETVMAIEVLEKIRQEIQQKTSISKVSLTSNLGYIYAGNAADICVTANIQYKATYDTDYRLITSVYESEEKIAEKETAITLGGEDTTMDVDVLDFSVKEEAPTQLLIEAIVYDAMGEEVYRAQTAVEVREKLATTDVLLIQTVAPWKTATNEEVLNELGISFDKVTAQEAQSIEYSDYRVVIVANDQNSLTYTILKRQKERLEAFVEEGGILLYGACGHGWNWGASNSYIPGDVKVNYQYQNNNYIVDTEHPIVTAMYSDGISLTDDDMYGNYASHEYFSKDTLPENTNIIFETKEGNPTLVEYRIGEGVVIASALTWENNYFYHVKFGKKALDDLFLYVLHISGSYEKEEPGTVESVIVLDQEEYANAETIDITITSELSAFQRRVRGEVLAMDTEGNEVEKIGDILAMDMIAGTPVTHTYAWNIPEDILAGDYKVIINWYDGEEIVGSGEKPFFVLPNGTLVDELSLSDKKVPAGTTVSVKDIVRNTSTNTPDKDLEVVLSVWDADNVLIQQFHHDIGELAPEGEKTVSSLLETNVLSEGKYTVKSQVYRGDTCVTSSEETLWIEEKNLSRYNLVGGLDVVVEENDIVIDYMLKNEGDYDIRDIPIKVGVIKLAEMQEVEACTDTCTIEKKTEETGKLDICTEQYEAGEYLVTLYAGESSEKVLDTVKVILARKEQLPEVETPTSEEPIPETPVVEEPEVETPTPEEPMLETPEVDTPIVETLEIETPVVEEPEVETPTVEDTTPAYLSMGHALIATENAVTINCCQADVNKDIYAKGNFFFSGSILNAASQVKTSGNVAAYGWIINIPKKEEQADVVAIEDYTDKIVEDIKKDSQEYESLDMYNSTTITVPTLCKGTTGAYCTYLDIKERLVSEGSISLNCNEATIGTENEKTVLCSMNGDININATKAKAYGLIYAPNGTVSINVSEFDLVGTIIAKEIKINGSYIRINQ
nr:hypothetical protein [Eubacterium sp.]